MGSDDSSLTWGAVIVEEREVAVVFLTRAGEDGVDEVPAPVDAESSKYLFAADQCGSYISGVTLGLCLCFCPFFNPGIPKKKKQFLL